MSLFLDLPGNSGDYASATPYARSLSLPGASGDYASTPDSAALDITGDIDIRVDLALDDWAGTAADQVLVAKYDQVGDQRSYRLYVHSTGSIQFAWSSDGAWSGWDWERWLELNASDGGRVRLRVTLDVDDGAGNHVVRWYTSDDFETWTLQETDTAAGVTSIMSGSADLLVGARTGFDEAAGTVYAAQVYDGIDGTLVADFDPTRGLVGASSFTASTGETWTINGNAVLAGVTGDIDIRVHLAPDTWSGSEEIVERWQSGKSWRLATSTSGFVQLRWSPDNSTVITSSSAPMPFADGEAGWVRVTLDVDNGSNQHVISWYTSTDGVSWSLSDVDTYGGTTSIFAGSSAMQMGTSNGNNRLSGSLYSVEVRDGIDGTLVASFDADDAHHVGDRSWKSRTTGERWTLFNNVSVQSLIGPVMAGLAMRRHEGRVRPTPSRRFRMW